MPYLCFFFLSIWWILNGTKAIKYPRQLRSCAELSHTVFSAAITIFPSEKPMAFWIAHHFVTAKTTAPGAISLVSAEPLKVPLLATCGLCHLVSWGPCEHTRTRNSYQTHPFLYGMFVSGFHRSSRCHVLPEPGTSQEIENGDGRTREGIAGSAGCSAQFRWHWWDFATYVA